MNKTIESIDSRRKKIVPGELPETLKYAAENFLETARIFIEMEGSFHVALSGGSTPKSIYEIITSQNHHPSVDWTKVHLYWSDERSVPPYDPASNYRMAMEAGFGSLHIPANNIHRMQAEGDVAEGAKAYDKLLSSQLPEGRFHMILLGVGEDGHTASLFPYTPALEVTTSLVTENWIESMKTHRMTLTFNCINSAERIVFYATGKGKHAIVNHILGKNFNIDETPAAAIGTDEHPALWILDHAAAQG